MAIAQLNAVRT